MRTSWRLWVIYLLLSLVFGPSHSKPPDYHSEKASAISTGVLVKGEPVVPVVFVGQAFPEEYEEGDQIGIPIMAKGFTAENALYAVTLHIGFHEQVLTYEGFTGKSLGVAIVNATNDTFSLAWNSVAGTEIADDTLGVIHFQYNGGFTDLFFREGCELSGEDVDLEVDYLDGEAGFQVSMYHVTLNVSPPEGGTATLADEGPFPEEETVTATAQPATGYDFMNWTEADGQTIVSEDLVYGFQIFADTELTANFILQSFQVTTSVSPPGSGMVEGAGTYDFNTSAVLTAFPENGYAFSGWYEDNLLIETDNPLELLVEADRHFEARFSRKSYTLLYEAGPGGFLSGETEQTVFHGESGSAVEATPYHGYYFSTWSDESTENPRTDYEVTADLHLIAEFLELGQFSVTLAANPSEAGVLSGGGTFYDGETAMISAEANQGYVFENWTMNEDVLSDNPEFTLTVTGNMNLLANFSPMSFEVSVSISPEGAGEVTGTGDHHYGSEIKLIATPNEGFDFSGWYEDDLLIETDRQLALLVEADRHFEVRFSRKSYTLLYEAGPGGSLSGETEQTVLHGESGSAVEAIPDDGYYFSNWSDGSTANPRTDYEVTADRHLEAQFEPIQYTLRYLSGEGGSLAGETIQTVLFGDSGTPVEAISHNGYHFLTWDDGQTSNPRTDVDVSADLAVTAIFEQLKYTISFLVEDDDGSAIDDAKIVFAGTEYEEGVYVFKELVPGVYGFSVLRDGYFPVSGEAEVDKQDIEQLVVLTVDNTGINGPGNQQSSPDRLRVYPNPTINQLSVSTTFPIKRVIVYNQLGKAVIAMEEPGISKEVFLNVESLKAGVYLLQVLDSKGLATERFIISR